MPRAIDLAMPAASAGEELVKKIEALADFHDQITGSMSAINQMDFGLLLPEIHLHFPQIDVQAITQASEIAESVKSIVLSLESNWLSQIESVTSGLSEIGKRMVADFAAMDLAWDNLIASDIFKNLEVAVEMKKDEVDAFCAAGWPVAPSMPPKLRRRVVELHQNGKTRYVSQSVMGYYRRQNYIRLSEAVDSWRQFPLFAPRFHILADALDAHRDGKYTLSVPALLPQIEGILSDYVKKQGLVAKFGRIRDVYTAAIGDVDDYGLAEWAIVQTLLHLLQTSTYAYTSFEDELRKSRASRKTTRHTVLHGVDAEYHRQSHSLRSFLLMDAISVLE